MARGKYVQWCEPESLLLIEGWARDGLTNEQIAHNIGVNIDTLFEWRKRFPEISEALKNGREVADRTVENALYKKATGYEYEEVTEELRFDKATGEKRMVVTKRVKKIVPPDTVAQIFWLKNRKPGEWRDKRDVEMTGSAAVQIIDDIPKDVTDDPAE